MALLTGTNIGIFTGTTTLAEHGWKTSMESGLRALDLLAQATVADKDLNTPPGSPADGAAYIVAASPTGAWAGKAGQIARYSSAAGAWEFWAPKAGWRVHVQDESVPYTYTGTAWTSTMSLGALTVSDLSDGQVVLAGPNGRLRSDAGVTYVRIGSVTRLMIIGDGAVAGAAQFAAKATSGYLAGHSIMRPDGTIHWATYRATSGILSLQNHDASGTVIDAWATVADGLGGVITFGGGAGTKRDVNFTGNIQTGAAQRISSGGRFDATSLYNSAWAGSGIRPLLTDNAGMGYATDAATFCAAISALTGAGVAGRLSRWSGTGSQTSDSGLYTEQEAGGTTRYVFVGATDGGAGYFIRGASASAWALFKNATGDFEIQDKVTGDSPIYIYKGSGLPIAVYRHLDIQGTNRIKMSGTQVLGPRKTGWTACTGTAQRSGFDTVTATITDVKQTIKALIDDLISHGIIGA